MDVPVAGEQNPEQPKTSSSTPGTKRKLAFKMVEDVSVSVEYRSSSKEPEVTSSPPNGYHKTGSTEEGAGEGHRVPASGRHSPHIPHSTRAGSPVDWIEAPTKVYTQQYLPPDHDPTKTYMLRQHTPNPPKVPGYHAPEGPGVQLKIHRKRRGMEILRDACLAQARENIPWAPPVQSGRKSPHLNNEEPILLSTFPDARPAAEEEQAKIDRDDFPAPPYAYADPERRKRYINSPKKQPAEDEVDEAIIDPKKVEMIAKEEERFKKEAEELKKISSGIGKVFLHTVEERAKHRTDRSRAVIDPRNASRTASANREPRQPPRYGSPAFASPSRLDDRPRPWEEWEYMPSPHTKWRSASSGASTLPSYSIPRYGISTATTPKSGTIPHGRYSPGLHDMIFEDGTFVSDEIPRTQSGDFASTTIPESYFDRNRPYGDSMFVRSRIVEPYYQADFLEAVENVMPSVRKQRKIYPIERLLTLNRKLPEDVDRNHLELHISNEDFQAVFRMTREEFFRLPDWKRNELKRRAKLF